MAIWAAHRSRRFEPVDSFLARTARCRAKARCSTFARSPAGRRLESHFLRRGMEAVRRGLGPDVFYRTIAGPIGPRMGLANDLRISGDSHGNELRAPEYGLAVDSNNDHVYVAGRDSDNVFVIKPSPPPPLPALSAGGLVVLAVLLVMASGIARAQPRT